MQPKPFFPYFVTFYHGKNWLKIFGHFCNLNKLPKVNNPSTDEGSPILVTLTITLYPT
jgi:hypothetical protein